MATTLHPSPVPTPSTSNPPTPPYPAFPRLPSGTPSISRNASTSSSRSDTTISSTTSSLVAAPMRPPPIETRTAATTPAPISSRPSSTEPSHTTPPSPLAYNHGNHSPSPQTFFGGRGFMRNGPRARSTLPPAPSIVTSSPSPDPPHAIVTPERSHTAPLSEYSPTTPRAPRWASPSPDSDVAPRVTVSMDPSDARKEVRGRDGKWSTPSSPTDKKSPRMKQRTLSADGRGEDLNRERRQSQASAHSSGSAGGAKKPSLKDFILGEELGRGSYSTVVQATSAHSSTSNYSPRQPRQYAIKIINQAHLVAEKKVKYALIERDALIRLALPSKDSQSRGHRRGVSSSSSAGTSATAKRRTSTASIGSAAGTIPKRDPITPNGRLTVSTDVGGSVTSGGPTSPVSRSTLAGRRPSRSAEPPEMVPERSEENVIESPKEGLRSKPPSPVKEESSEYIHDMTPPNRNSTRMDDSPIVTTAPPTPDPGAGEKRSQRTRRTSLAPSERSVRSGKSQIAHPGVIRLHSTFNDQTSLYFVLDLAKNGELLTFIRKFGSFDMESARYYAAQLIDTIEFMQERGVIHRDLKPENILLDDEMRTKITDFGSAKLVGKEGETTDDDRKRSFVGSADFVSPEVLRNEPAVFASDIWAFGCILYQLVVGRPPFRGATDYLTFQKILKRDMEYPAGVDEEAKSLIELILNLDPLVRPSPADIKNHSFFSSIDFISIWQISAPVISTGLTKPVATLATVPPESDIWAVFDEEVSDGGFEYDDAGPQPNGNVDITDEESARREAPVFDHHAARFAVHSVDHAHNRTGSSASLEPPKPAYMEGKRSGRGWSITSRSARTSSSSSNNRTALTGLLENMGIVAPGTNSHAGTPSTSMSTTSTAGWSGTPRGSTRTSRTSDRSEEAKTIPSPVDDDRWSSLLLANERILLSTPISVRPAPAGSTLIPSFLLSAGKRRQLILTDFPRLVEVKDDSEGPGPRVKFEAVFVRQPSETNEQHGHGVGTNRVIDVLEKGSKGFIVNTAGASVLYLADSADVRNQWVQALKTVPV